MDLMQLLMSLGMVAGAMYVIKYACDSFEDSSKYLGRTVYKMKPGVRGATIEAIASSLPELFTTTFLLFVYNDMDGFSAGIATCAGSALDPGQSPARPPGPRVAPLGTMRLRLSAPARTIARSPT